MQLLPWKTAIKLSQGIIIHKHQQQDISTYTYI